MVKRWVLALVGILCVVLVAQEILARRSRSSGVAAGDAYPRSDAPAVVRVWPAPSERTKQLVTTLSEIDVRPGAVTPAAADTWQRNLAALQDFGIEAVPAIAEYFQKNTDVRFDAGPGPNLLGVSTLRMAFMKVLFDIPTPDNVDLQLQVLAVTNDPDEVVLLASQLDMQEPKKHRLLVIDAARRSLASARQGQFPGRDTGPVAKLLQTYEGAIGR